MRENEKINITLKQDVKEMSVVVSGFEKRRKKLSDAEIRAHTQKRKAELAKASQGIDVTMEQMTVFENLLAERKRNPNKQGEQ